MSPCTPKNLQSVKDTLTVTALVKVVKAEAAVAIEFHIELILDISESKFFSNY